LNTDVAHQTFNGAAGDIKLLSFHCVPQLARAIDRQVIFPDPLHLRTQFGIPLGATRRKVWITLNGQMRIER
jgi:hypothetical protein